MILTERDIDILTMLTSRVRLLALRMVFEVFGVAECSQRHGLKRRIRSLVQSRLIDAHWVNAQPVPELRRPLLVWMPGQDEPDVERISSAARNRPVLEPAPTLVLTATGFSANLMGSTAVGLPRLEQLDHDLRLAAVYVHYRQRHPQLASQWIGEHVLPKAGFQIKDPDAFLCDANGRVRRVIEAAGRYSTEQVRSFHDHCSEHDLPYEMW